MIFHQEAFLEKLWRCQDDAGCISTAATNPLCSLGIKLSADPCILCILAPTSWAPPNTYLLGCCGQVKDMKEEREGLLKDLAKLKTALQQLAARNQGTATTCRLLLDPCQTLCLGSSHAYGSAHGTQSEEGLHLLTPTVFMGKTSRMSVAEFTCTCYGLDWFAYKAVMLVRLADGCMKCSVHYSTVHTAFHMQAHYKTAGRGLTGGGQRA